MCNTVVYNCVVVYRYNFFIKNNDHVAATCWHDKEKHTHTHTCTFSLLKNSIYRNSSLSTYDKYTELAISIKLEKNSMTKMDLWLINKSISKRKKSFFNHPLLISHLPQNKRRKKQNKKSQKSSSLWPPPSPNHEIQIFTTNPIWVFPSISSSLMARYPGRVIFLVWGLISTCVWAQKEEVEEGKPWRIHTLFSVECQNYFDWQTVGLMHSYKKARQPGPITRLLSCTDEEKKSYKGMDLAPTFEVPSMSKHPKTGDWYFLFLS